MWTEQSITVPREIPLTIYVNQVEFATVLCTPQKLNYLAIGFLFSEGLIENTKEIAFMRVCDEESEVDVRLTHDVATRRPRTLTSGCGGSGLIALPDVERLRVCSDFRVAVETVAGLMGQLVSAGETYREHGGIHTAVLADENELLVVAEDIGRHNAVDKVKGECLLKSIPTDDRILVATGRISSEMLLKGARMKTPVIISRSAATGHAIEIAEKLGISLIGYARGDKLTVYSHPERILD